LCAQLAERWVDAVTFDPNAPEFAAYQRTVWAELERKLFVVRRALPSGATGFRLTPRGWLVALMGHEFAEPPEDVSSRLHRIARVLKNHCSRDQIAPVRVPLDAIADEAQMPPGWVRNAIVSRMLGYVIRDKHMDVWCEDSVADEGPAMVVILSGFGQPKLPR
jgi:hypothetical protein